MAVLEYSKVELETVMLANEESFKKTEQQARDTKKRIDKDMVTQLTLNIANFQKALELARGKLALAKKEGDKNAEIQLRVNTIQLQNLLTEAKRQLNNYVNTGEKDVSRFGNAFDGLRNKIVSIGNVFKANLFQNLFDAVKGIGQSIINLGTSFEQTEIAFTTMLGSAEEAKNLLGELNEFAKNTPFDLVGVRNSSKQLLAFGFTAKEIIPTLSSLGDVSAGLSVPLEQIVYAYGQVRTANQLYGTELRQFVNAGVPLLAELATMFGKTEAETKKMVENGQVSFKMVEQAFMNMSSEGGKFYNLQAKQSESVKGQWEKLKDTLVQLGESLGTYLLPLFGKFVEGINFVIEAVIKFIGFFSFITDGIKYVIDSFNQMNIVLKIMIGVLVGIPAVAIPATAAITGLATAIGIATTALWGWVAIVGGVLIGMYKLGEAYNELQSEMEALAKAEDSYMKTSQEAIETSRELAKESERLKNIDGEAAKMMKTKAKALLSLNLAQSRLTQIEKDLNKENSKFFKNEEKIQKLQQEKLVEQNKINEALRDGAIANDYLAGKEEELGLTTTNTTNTISGMANEIANLETKAADLESQLGNAELSSEEWEKLRADIIATQTLTDELIASLDTLGFDKTGKLKETKKTGGGGGKSAEEIRIEKQEKALEKEALTQIQALKEQNLAQEEYSEKANEIYEKYQREKDKLRESELEKEMSAIEELNDMIEKAEEQRLKTETKAIETKYKHQIEAIKKYEKDQTIANQKILEIQKKMNEELDALDDDYFEKEFKRVEKLEAKREEANEKLQDQFEEVSEYVEQYQDSFEEAMDTSKDLINDLTKEVEDLGNELTKINEELDKATNKMASDLGKRSGDIEKDIDGIQTKIKELQNKDVSLSVAQGIGLDTLKNIGSGDIAGTEVKDLIQILELNNQLNSLLREREILEEYKEQNKTEITDKKADLEAQKQDLELRKSVLENQKNEAITQEDIDKAQNELLETRRQLLDVNQQIDSINKQSIEQQEAFNALTDTEKIIAEFEAEKKAIQDKKVLKETELIETQARLDKEKIYYADLEEEKENLEKKFADYKIGIEEQISSKIALESKNRINMMKLVEEQAIRTANALREAGMASANATATTGTSNTNNNTNNTLNFNNNYNVNSGVDMATINSQQARQIQAAKKGINV